MNVYNLTLNLDKTQRITNPTVVHRIGDKAGTTIKVTIIGGQIYSPVLVLNFENGEEISINGVANGSTITIVLNNRFNDNLGKARCYIKGNNGVSTQTFTILCIEDIHFTDNDLVWGNANFKDKVAGDTNSNPNILARYHNDWDAIAVSWPSINAISGTVKHSMTLDDFKGKTYEVPQKNYDALKNGFYDEYKDNREYVDSNYLQSNLSNEILRTRKTVIWTGITNAVQYVEAGALYPIIARFKVPSGTKKVRINNILNGRCFNDFKDPNKDLSYSSKTDNFESGLLITWSGNNVNFINPYDSKLSPVYMDSPYNYLKDLKNAKVIDYWEDRDYDTNVYTINPNTRSIEVDTFNNSVIDPQGYIDYLEDPVLISGRILSYPQINIDYAYLDLS